MLRQSCISSCRTWINVIFSLPGFSGPTCLDSVLVVVVVAVAVAVAVAVKMV